MNNKSNSKDSTEARSQPLPKGGPIKGSMKTEEPSGWDQAPQNISDPEKKRHPRPDGAGGLTPADFSNLVKRKKVHRR